MPVPLRARLVEVVADLGANAASRYKYGSGCIVRGRTVLTAAHVIDNAQAVQVRGPDKKLKRATALAGFIGAAPGPDLALVEIDDAGAGLDSMELAVVERDDPKAAPVANCHAIGYPWFAETPGPTARRDTVDAIGYIPVLSKLAGGLLTVQVTDSPRPLPPGRTALGESEWSGMSGAPVVADGCLIGVISEHAPREGSSAITAVPLSALEHDPAYPDWGPGVQNAAEWWARLGVPGIAGLRRLPSPQAPRHREKNEAAARDAGGADPGGSGRVTLSGAERRQLLAALSDAFHTQSQIDGVLDDLGFAPGHRPQGDGTIVGAWRALLHELDAGRLGDGYRALLELVLESYEHNPTFAAVAARHGVTRPRHS
jgi:hypothetical protein